MDLDCLEKSSREDDKIFVPITFLQNVLDFIKCVKTFWNIYVVNTRSVFYFWIKMSAPWVMKEANEPSFDLLQYIRYVSWNPPA